MHYTCTLYSCTSVALELVYCTHIWPNYSHKLDFKELGESSSTRLLLDWGSSTLVREHICSWKNTVLKRSMLFLNLFSSSRLTESYFFRGWSVGLIESLLESLGWVIKQLFLISVTTHESIDCWQFNIRSFQAALMACDFGETVHQATVQKGQGKSLV